MNSDCCDAWLYFRLYSGRNPICAVNSCVLKTRPLFYEPHRTPGAGRSLFRARSIYTRDHFSMSHTEFPAQAAVYHEERDKKTTRARGDWMVMRQPG
eukprot:scaffold66344_cov68-Phaeocystis_antarctica.AAC.2